MVRGTAARCHAMTCLGVPGERLEHDKEQDMLKPFIILAFILAGMWGVWTYTKDPVRMIGLIILGILLVYFVIKVAAPELL